MIKKKEGIEATNSEFKRKHVTGKAWTRGKERVTFAVYAGESSLQ